MTFVRAYLSIIILNVKGLNSSIKIHGVAGEIKNKIGPTISYLKRLTSALRLTLIGSRWRDNKGTACKWKPRVGIAILGRDKIDFKPKMVTRDK